MLALILVISLFVSSDTMEVKGTRNIIYRVFVSNQNLYFQYKAGKNWSAPTILDSVNCYSPSIAVTPGDFIHIVWQKGRVGEERIYYTTSDKVSPEGIRNGIPPRWTEPIQISTQQPLSEPATNPFVEAYGEGVYVVWRGPNELGNPEYGEIWQRVGRIRVPGTPPVWFNPQNISQSTDQESNYPVMSTSVFTAWQEMDHGNWEIKLKYKDDPPYNISNTPTPSKYPHINALISEYQRPIIYALWTEEFQPDIFEAKFLRMQYPPEQDNGDDEIIYYPVNVGESVPSIYCAYRDGYIPYSNFPIDYGNNQIAYKLKYLNPSYFYKVRAIMYHNSTGLFQQRFFFNDIPNAFVNFQPGIPETIEIYIPQSSYAEDFISKVKVKRHQGNFSALASFDVFQYEILDSIGGSEYGIQNAKSNTRQFIVTDNLPNPFKNQTQIRFSLPQPMRVAIKVYNSNGQLVRTLLNETKQAGDYNIIWDGKDNQNKSVTAGVYFYRIETNDFSQTKKVILTR